MTIDSYFENYFSSDTEILKENEINCLCNRIWSKIYKEKLDLELTDVKLFTICSYELNLISQVLYTHFKTEHEDWLKTVPEFIDCRCTYSSSPISIFRWAKLNAKKAGRHLYISQKDIIESDLYFYNKLFKVLPPYITPSTFKSAIQNDPDCNLEYLIRELNKSL